MEKGLEADIIYRGIIIWQPVSLILLNKILPFPPGYLNFKISSTMVGFDTDILLDKSLISVYKSTMITLTIALALLGFFMLYSTSRRASLTLQYSFQKWMADNRKTSTYLGLLLLGVSLLSGVMTWGFGAGVFGFLVVIMTVASLTIILAPLRFFKRSVVIGLLLLGLTLELLIR